MESQEYKCGTGVTRTDVPCKAGVLRYDHTVITFKGESAKWLATTGTPAFITTSESSLLGQHERLCQILVPQAEAAWRQNARDKLARCLQRNSEAKELNCVYDRAPHEQSGGVFKY